MQRMTNRMAMTSVPTMQQQTRYSADFHTWAGSCLFLFLAAVFLAWPVWRSGLTIEVNRNEPWNAWFTDAILNGTPLYPRSAELIVNNYPPLSFYIVALVSKLTGDTIFAGRLVSLASTLFVSISAALCIRALGGSRAAAVLGGSWLLATLGRFFSYYVGVNDPSLLALAMMGLGLAYFLHLQRQGRTVEPAIALMVVAGFVKHVLPDIPLAALLWLATMQRQKALRAALFGATLSSVGLVLCYSVFGPDFATQMLMPRQISLSHVAFVANRLQWIAPAVIVWAIWAWPNREKPAARFTALLLGTSLVNGFIQAAGVGVFYNAYFGVVFASAVGLGIAFEDLGRTALARRSSVGGLQIAVVAVLVVRLLLSQQPQPYLVLFSHAFRDEVRQNETEMNAEIRRIANIPGAVACSTMSACYRAGKAFVYDSFWVPQLIAKGKWTPEAVAGALKERKIRFEDSDSNVKPSKRRLF